MVAFGASSANPRSHNRSSFLSPRLPAKNVAQGKDESKSMMDGVFPNSQTP